MSIQSKSSKWVLVKKAMLFVAPMTLFYAGYASAGAADIGVVATTLSTTFKGLLTFLTSASYLIGFALIMAAMFKFKAHKDNPQGTPLGMPMMLLFVGGMLMFLPSLVPVASGSLGLTATGGISGISSIP